MELIMPAEISGKIITLIESAKDKIIIISPYNKINGWTKLTKRIKIAQANGVNIEWYIRKNVDGNYAEIKQLGIEPTEIENLHCKIYMNEKTAIVSSMNLHEFSDKNSIDIGYFVSNEKEYLELLNFVQFYISKPNYKIKIDNSKIVNNNHAFVVLLELWLKDKFPEYTKEIKSIENKYGTGLELSGFKEYYKLIFEPKAYYFRIDLRIQCDYKTKNEIFNDLRKRSAQLITELGREIEFGSEMKRLKIDISEFHNVQYKNWGLFEFDNLKPIIEKTIHVFSKEL